MSAIFISHSSRDNALAKALERRLAERHHHSVFLDLDPEKGIVGGQSWERTLYRKLRACRAVIALCTDDYLRSQWCFAEIALARMEGKPVVGVLAKGLAEGATLPAILTERQLIDFRGDEEEGYQRLWRALDQIDLRGLSSNWDPRRPPYLGLEAYQEEHAPVFFGREEESLLGVELLDRGSPGLIVVLGASGSGKSSLVRAGVLPRLRAREDWLILDPFRPGRDPWAELTESLVQGYARYARSHLDEPGRRERLREGLRAGWRTLEAAGNRGEGEAAAADVAADPAVPTPPEASRASESAGAPDERLRRLLDLLERLREDPPPLTERLRNYLEWSLDDLRRLCAPGGLAAAHGSSSAVTPEAAAGAAAPLLDAVDELRRLAQRRGARVLLVVDQLEELLGRERTDPGDGGFLALLRAAVEAEHSPLTVLCTLRSDFLGSFQRHPALRGADFETLSLGPMRIDAMRRVIEMPARLAAIEIEEGLVDRLLADTATPDALPLLSFTLWVMCRDRKDEGKLEVAEYERLGGLQGTITREADLVLTAAAREHRQDDLRRALLQMARLSEDGRYARRPLDWDSPEAQRVEPLLAQLVDRRVLVSRLEGERRVVEVAHEALFRAWAPLRGWLDTSRAELLLRQQVERDASVWREGGRPPDALWRGGRLLQARDLVLGARRPRSSGEADAATEFVRAGMRRRARQRATLISIAISTIVVLAGFLAYALVQAGRARREKDKALDTARVAIAGEWLEKDPTSGALVLLELTDPANTRFAPRRLSEALKRGVVRAEYRHSGPVHSVAISHDGSRVLTTSGRAALVWEAFSGRLLHTLQHDEGVVAGAFDPTGRFAVTRSGAVGERYSDDRTGNRARVWEVETGSPRFVVTHDDVLNGAAVSPQGRFLVTTSDDKTAQLWDVEAGRRRFTLKHEAAVHDAVFAPNGELLVTLSADSAHVWRVDSDQLVVTVTHDGGTIEAASFSPDGVFLVTVGRGGTRAWNVETWKVRRTFAEPSPRTASFSPDGRYLLSRSDDGVARLWQFETARQVFEAPVVTRGLRSAGFSQDGSLVMTAGGHADRRGYGVPRGDNTVRYWNARTGMPRGLKDFGSGSEAMTVAFDPEGRMVVVNSAQRVGAGRNETLRQIPTATLWDVGIEDARLRRALRLDAAVSAASFSPDGLQVLTVAGTAARLWDAATGKARLVLNHQKDVIAAAFTADGSAIVTASRDGTARLWDAGTGRQRFAARHREAVEDAQLVANGRLLATISGHKGRLWRVGSGTAEAGAQLVEMADDLDPIGKDARGDNFSPDGRLAVVRSGRTAQVWDVAAGKVRFTLAHDGWVRTAAFIADGRSLVTTADEKVARVWDMTTGRAKHTLKHPREVAVAAISPDGRTLLTSQDDGVARLWDTGTGKVRFTFLHGCGARDARFIAGGTLAVTWSRAERLVDCEGKVMVWDVATGQLRSAVSTLARSIGFSDNGKVMYTTESEGYSPGSLMRPEAHTSVRVWDVDTGEERFADPFRDEQDLRIAALSPDADQLLTASGNTVSIWAVEGGLLQATLSAATTLCLTREFRRQYLGESDAEAMQAYEACERKHGRK